METETVRIAVFVDLILRRLLLDVECTRSFCLKSVNLVVAADVGAVVVVVRQVGQPRDVGGGRQRRGKRERRDYAPCVKEAAEYTPPPPGGWSGRSLPLLSFF